MFVDLISKKMEVYVDDMLVKSLKISNHVKYLDKSFWLLRRYKMSLIPLKCMSGVTSIKFLGYMVNQRGIKVNPKNIKAPIEMKSPQKLKEV